MSVPVGYKFTPTDQELVIDYLEIKSKGKALPCDVVFEREIYGTGNKAPWQIFTKNDPWEEGSVYVLTKLIKATGSDKRTARTAGCGSWHGETGPVRILDKKHRVIGYKRMLRFRIKNGSEAMDESGEGGRWIMHEFSLYGGNGTTSTRNKQSPKGSEYVLCRIKKIYNSKDNKKSPKKVKNVEVPRPAKRARKEVFEQEQDVEALETENIVPYSQELLEAEKEGHYSQILSDVDADLELLRPMLESEQLASIGPDFDASDPRTLSWLPPTPFSEEFSKAEEQGNYSQMLFDMDADLDFDALDPQTLSGHVQTPSSEELSEAKKQENYSQMLFDMDADLDFDALDPQALSGLAQTPFSEELSEAEKQGNYSQMLSSMSDADLHEELISILESEQPPSSISLDSWLPGPTVPTPFFEEFSEAEEQGNYSQMLSDVDADTVELVPILEYLEQLPSFSLDFDVLSKEWSL
ncbi:NAC domain-containing protein 67-like [Rhododendron vialii]|uniref:NAC domain-containing protein 67-like n=1 Tax=Rhododendron vialii TaxID=182163 RepID=UPI00265E6E18|nr:NAC domain-containing protein 67-like [Rhododendron vialii]